MTANHNGNWFAVSRLIFDHYLVGIHDRAYTELEAWLWLIAQASYSQREIINRGDKVVLDPGQMMHARVYLAETWLWSEDKVRWFLKRLENEAMITRYCASLNAHRRTNQIQVITICNYGHYQFPSDTTPSNTPSNTPSKIDQSHPANEAGLSAYNNGLTIGVDAIAPSKNDVSHPALHPATHPQDNKDKHLNTESTPHKSPKGGQRPLSVRVRGSRLPIDWELPIEWRRMAKEQFVVTDAQVTTEAHAFRDYFLSVAGDKGTKIDWCRTWSNWIRRNYAERGANSASPPPWWQNLEKVNDLAREPGLERWRDGIATYANGLWPVDKLGPPPGNAQCVVPHELIDELRLTERYDHNGIERVRRR